MSTIEAPAARRRAEPAAAPSPTVPPRSAAVPVARPSVRRIAWSSGRAWTWRTTLLALVIAYASYTLAKLVGADDLGVARSNALWVVELERGLGVDVEGPVQRALDGSVSIWIFNHLYMAAQFLVVPAVLFLVRTRSITAFRRLRDTLVATWIIATPVNAFFAVAPPRLADIGITDTITASGSGALTSGLSTAFYNPLAAVPSLHVAFAFAVGIAAALTFRSGPVRLLGLAWGPIIALTVVATGNHYLFDAVAGIAVTLLGLAIAVAPRRSPVPFLRRGLAAAGTLALTPAPSVVSLRSVTRPVATAVARRDGESPAERAASPDAGPRTDDARPTASRGRGRCCSIGR
ncbi:phosphatase PAP2 family protein [Patulibacter americanus]|uniref:phosphatase PAP2 family protein n=1 Tax=Patulibacter americanus TaxID=588672 RepID=UPI0003B78C91|nr:phosphatase PAP2 family protein [Patulibacter americanus]